MNIKRYEFEENVLDRELFAADGLAFSVLYNIVNNKCTLVLTDHERFIICYSAFPFPVWIWNVADITEEEKEQIWQICAEEKLLPGCDPDSKIDRINMKYDLADFFMKKSKEAVGVEYGIVTNLLAYECFHTIPPTRAAEGIMGEVRPEDVEDVFGFMCGFHQETGVDQLGKEELHARAESVVGNPNFHLWRNAAGENVAMCSGTASEGFGKVGYVYCKPSERRKGYTQQMIYQVTEGLMAQGLRPILYTDGDYAASNGCYKKVGYKEQGGLCTIGVV